MNAQHPRGGIARHDVTLTARVTREERDLVAAQARAAGIDVSELVRRAVFPVALEMQAALDSALERGRRLERAEVEQPLASLRAELARAQESARRQRARANAAEYQLHRYERVGPLIQAVSDVLRGVDDAKVAAASLWALLPEEGRRQAMPAAVTMALEAVDGIAVPKGRLAPTDQTVARVEKLFALTKRLYWLMHNLDPRTGSVAALPLSPEWDVVDEAIWTVVQGFAKAVGVPRPSEDGPDR